MMHWFLRRCAGGVISGEPSTILIIVVSEENLRLTLVPVQHIKLLESRQIGTLAILHLLSWSNGSLPVISARLQSRGCPSHRAALTYLLRC